MLRDITIGQYYRTDSDIHRLCARTKIISTFILVITLFFFKGLWQYILAAGFVGTIIVKSHVPFKFIVRGAKPVMVLIVFTAICQLLFTKTGTLLCDLGFIRIYTGAVSAAILFTVRILFLIIVTSMMTYTTTPNQLTDGLEAVFKPLAVFKVPVHDMSMIMSIALRFIPILVEECDKIMKAQMARGAELEQGNILKRAKNLIPIFIPLFVSAFKRATDLAQAMESRCYRGGTGRTKMYPLKYKKADYIAYISVVAFVVMEIIISHM